MKVRIDPGSKEPIYKQIVQQMERAVREGHLAPGLQIESMNELAARENISKETVKKAYGVLVEKGIIIPKQGKGFYTADLSAGSRPTVLVLFDKLSIYKQLLFNSFASALGNRAETRILTHNQEISLLEYYLDSYLDMFDYYVVTPHFPLDDKTQERVRRQIARIPNRKLIMLDRLLPDYPGNYGAVYQNFENDIYGGLSQGNLDSNCHLKVMTLPESLYGGSIRKGIERYCHDRHVPVSFYTGIPEDITPGDTFLVLNSQLDDGLVGLARHIRTLGLTIGRDVRIISYNEFAMNELVLDGLTTVSTDFQEMGRLAAGMILEKSLHKVHCPFRMTRRSTF